MVLRPARLQKYLKQLKKLKKLKRQPYLQLASWLAGWLQRQSLKEIAVSIRDCLWAASAREAQPLPGRGNLFL